MNYGGLRSGFEASDYAISYILTISIMRHPVSGRKEHQGSPDTRRAPGFHLKHNVKCASCGLDPWHRIDQPTEHFFAVHVDNAHTIKTRVLKIFLRLLRQ